MHFHATYFVMLHEAMCSYWLTESTSASCFKLSTFFYSHICNSLTNMTECNLMKEVRSIFCSAVIKQLASSFPLTGVFVLS